jgi:hypothetical protein
MVFNGAQFHMLVNHLPVVGFVFLIIGLGVAMRVKSLDIKRFVLLSTVLIGASALAPYWTGEPAEEVIEHLPGVSEKNIHAHEEMAEKATVLAVVTACFAAASLYWQRRKPESFKKSIPVVFALAVLTAGAMGMAAHEGGKIRHPEIDPMSESD